MHVLEDVLSLSVSMLPGVPDSFSQGRQLWTPTVQYQQKIVIWQKVKVYVCVLVGDCLDTSNNLWHDKCNMEFPVDDE